jgi:hypothetical protein
MLPPTHTDYICIYDPNRQSETLQPYRSVGLCISSFSSFSPLVLLVSISTNQSVLHILFCRLGLIVPVLLGILLLVTDYGLDDRGIGVRVPVGAVFSPLHVVQTGPGVNSPSYQIGTGGCFPRGKAWNVKLTIHLRLVPRLGVGGTIYPLHHTSLCVTLN